MDCILVATDLSARADRALRRAARLAEAHGADLHVLHVIDHALPERLAAKFEADTRRELEKQVAGIAKQDAAPALHVVQGDPSADVHATAREIDADLIVLGLHRARPLIDVFRETTLERLVRLSHRAVLVVRDPVEGDYERVLAAMDFSPSSSRAAQLATAIFPKAELRGFHAVHVPFGGLVDRAGHAADTAFYLREAEAERTTWAARDDYADLAKKVEIAEGALHEVLARQMARFRPELLALGAHGRSGRAPFLLGSFANDMMRDPPCDLLIARG